MFKSIDKQWAARMFAAILLLATVGCGSKFVPIDTDAAQKTLANTLDAWKGGRNPSDLRQQEPAIFVSDDFEDNGRKLTSYKIDGPGTTDTRGNLRVPVTLTLKAPKAPETVKTAYIVTMQPKITVFREFQE